LYTRILEKYGFPYCIYDGSSVKYSSYDMDKFTTIIFIDEDKEHASLTVVRKTDNQKINGDWIQPRKNIFSRNGQIYNFGQNHGTANKNLKLDES
jgi:hypothetical protein